VTGLVVLAATVDAEIRLRVYRGGDLEAEAPLSRRRAVILASDLIDAALRELGDPLVLEAPLEDGVAGEHDAREVAGARAGRNGRCDQWA
jgi:hypothetical protein